MEISQKKEDVCKESTFKGLFNKHAEDLYRFIYYKFGAGYNPEDIMQEAFAKLWKNCATVPVDKAKSFLFTVANNQVLNEIDKQKTVLKYRQESVPKTYTNESPEFLMEEEAYMNKLQAALESLSEGQRVAFMLNRVEGKKHKEIAEILGISRKAVEKRIYSALSLVKEKLGNENLKI